MRFHKTLPVVKKRGPTSPTPLYERLHLLKRGPVARTLQDLGCKTCSRILGKLGQNLGKVHPSRFQLPCPHIEAKGWLGDSVEVLSKPLKDLRVGKPPR